MRNRKISIQNTLNYHYLLVIVLAILPIIFISVFFMVNIREYRQMIENVNHASAIQSNAENEIYYAVFYTVSGKDFKTDDRSAEE